MSNRPTDLQPADNDKRQEFRLVAALCFIAALLINLFCNSFSPFFIPEGAMDPNCFYAEACAVVHGQLPYRDFIDVKGPLLFLVYTVGYILTPTRCGGIFLLHVLATWGTLIAFFRTAEQFHLSPRAAALATALAACCLFSRFTAYWAAQPEQLLAFPFAWVLYYLTAFLKQPSSVRLRPLSCWLSIGATCTFLIKYNFVLPYIAVFGLAICIMARHLRAADIYRFCGCCLLYSALVCLPFIIYLSYHGLWGDFIYSYFLLNMEASANQQALTTFTFMSMMRKFAHPSIWLTYLVLGHAAVCALTKYKAAIDKGIIKLLLPVFLATYLSCFIGSWGYYYIMMAPTAIFLCIDISGRTGAVNFFKRYQVLKISFFALVFIFIINGYCLSTMAWRRPAESIKKIEAVQDMIARVPSPKMIYFNCPDFLLGRKAKSIPGTPAWMGLPNVPYRVYHQRHRDIVEGKADLIVTCGKVNKDLQLFFENSGYRSLPEARMDTVGPMRDVQIWALSRTYDAFLSPSDGI